MAKKIKKGKFEYNLASVLKVRDIREKQEKERFAETLKKLEEEQEKEKKAITRHIDAQQKLRDHFQGSDGLDFSMLFLQQKHIENMKEELDKQKVSTKKAENANEEQRQQLVQAIKDKKIIEKDKENKYKAWNALMNKEEMKFIDDIATIKYNSNKE